jgi:hypothetical protein
LNLSGGKIFKFEQLVVYLIQNQFDFTELVEGTVFEEVTVI